MSEFGRLMTTGNQFRYRGRFVPGPMLVALCHYAVDGQDPGDFLRAVLSNDLKEAVFLCGNYDSLGAICAFIYNELPPHVHGASDIVCNWLHTHQAQNRGLRPFDPRIADGSLLSGLGVSDRPEEDALISPHPGMSQEDCVPMDPASTPLGRMVNERVMEEDEERRERAEQWLKDHQ